MKTSELVKLLNGIDPAGQLECSVAGVAVSSAYADVGYLEYITDTGAVYVRNTTRIDICTRTIEDELWDSHNLDIAFIGFDSERLVNVRKHFEAIRQQVVQSSMDCEYELWYRWLSKFNIPNFDTAFSRIWYDKLSINHAATLPENTLKTRVDSYGVAYNCYSSYNDLRCMQWDELYHVSGSTESGYRVELKPGASPAVP